VGEEGSREGTKFAPGPVRATAPWSEVLDLHGRETRLYKTPPVNNNLVLAYVEQHVLGMPRSY
jgi:hypothetical protein